MAKTDGQRASDIKYKKEHTKQVTLRFFTNNESDSELLSHLLNQDNKNGYIKQLIREDMERGN